jgi:hypothetical protein
MNVAAGVVCTLMAKFLYSAAMSLDGFIAGPGGDVSWMVDSLGPNPVVDELITRTGAILVGNRTFGGDDPYKGREGEGEAFGGGWDGPQFVLTHRPPSVQMPGDDRDHHQRYGDSANGASHIQRLRRFAAEPRRQVHTTGLSFEVCARP